MHCEALCLASAPRSAMHTGSAFELMASPVWVRVSVRASADSQSWCTQTPWQPIQATCEGSNNAVIMCNSWMCCIDLHDAIHIFTHMLAGIRHGFALPEMLHSCGACGRIFTCIHQSNVMVVMFFLHKYFLYNVLSPLAILHNSYEYRNMFTSNFKRLCMQASFTKRQSWQYKHKSKYKQV